MHRERRMPDSHLLASIETEVRTEDLAFLLLDTGPLAPFEGRNWLRAPREGELVAVGLGSVMFASALGYHTPSVRLEHWSQESPSQDEEWDSRQEVSFPISGGKLQFCSLISLFPAKAALEVPPRTYRLRAYCRGQAAARAQGEQGNWMPVGVEQWLVQLWPADPLGDSANPAQ
jgi:hypothetical protein